MSGDSISIPSSFSLLGGLAVKNQDLAGAIVYVVAYALLLPLVAWRLGAQSSRALSVMWRPALFVLVRVVTFAIRAAQAGAGAFNESLFIAELVLLSVGTVFLASPLVPLLTFAYSISDREPLPKRSAKNTVFRLLQLALLAVIALGIYVGTQTSKSLDDPDKLDTLSTCRTAGGVLIIVVLAILVLGAVYVQVSFAKAPVKPSATTTGFIVLVGSLLLINSVYKLVVYYTKPNPLHLGTKVAFYCVFCVPEYLAAVTFFAVNLKTLFRIDEAEALQKGEWTDKAPTSVQMPMGEHAYPPPQQQQQQWQAQYP